MNTLIEVFAIVFGAALLLLNYDPTGIFYILKLFIGYTLIFLGAVIVVTIIVAALVSKEKNYIEILKAIYIISIVYVAYFAITAEGESQTYFAFYFLVLISLTVYIIYQRGIEYFKTSKEIRDIAIKILESKLRWALISLVAANLCKLFSICF